MLNTKPNILKADYAIQKRIEVSKNNYVSKNKPFEELKLMIKR